MASYIAVPMPPLRNRDEQRSARFRPLTSPGSAGLIRIRQRGPPARLRRAPSRSRGGGVTPSIQPALGRRGPASLGRLFLRESHEMTQTLGQTPRAGHPATDERRCHQRSVSRPSTDQCSFHVPRRTTVALSRRGADISTGLSSSGTRPYRRTADGCALAGGRSPAADGAAVLIAHTGPRGACTGLSPGAAEPAILSASEAIEDASRIHPPSRSDCASSCATPTGGSGPN